MTEAGALFIPRIEVISTLFILSCLPTRFDKTTSEVSCKDVMNGISWTRQGSGLRTPLRDYRDQQTVSRSTVADRITNLGRSVFHRRAHTHSALMKTGWFRRCVTHKGRKN